jgi:hypothetical protein
VRARRRLSTIDHFETAAAMLAARIELADMSAKWPETELLKPPLFGRYSVKSGHNSDIAEVERLTHNGNG